MGNFAYILGCSAAFCTAFYSFRLVFLTFVNVPNSFKTYVEHAHEPGLQMLIPLFVLAFGSLFSGFMFKEMFVGLGTPFFEGSIFVNYTPTIVAAAADAEHSSVLCGVNPAVGSDCD